MRGALAAGAISLAFATLAIATACAGAPDAAQLAKDDLATIVAREHLPGTWRIGELAWDAKHKAATGEARLELVADADGLGDAPTIAGDTFTVEAGPPPRMIAHAEVAKLRAAAARLEDARAAVELARGALKKLDRYGYWVKSKRRYVTQVSFERGVVRVYFDTPNITDNDVSVEVDPIKHVVTRVMVGTA
jgi:hypothetical protein